MNRRNFIRLTGMGTAHFFLVGSFLSAFSSCGKRKMTMKESQVSVIEGDFSYPLTFPKVTGGQLSLAAQITTYPIFKDKISKVLGYFKDSILGPTININAGDTVNIQLSNSLSNPTNIHWHGLIIPAVMDGHPKDIVQPGSSFSYNFSVTQRAGMYWYHPHPHGFTASQVFKGLAGVFFVRDIEESALNLPSGEFELPLVIQDKRVFPDYAIDYSPQMGEIMTGYMGPYTTVNGVYSPFHEVGKTYYRLRVLNGSNARIYNLALSDGVAFTVIGSDGGLLSSPQSAGTLILGPGERADLLLDFSGYSIGTELFLVSKIFNGGSAQGTEEFKILKFVVNKSALNNFALPAFLSISNPIQEANSSKVRTFNISNPGMAGGEHEGMNMKGMHKINDKIYDENRTDETVQGGATEIWVFDNSTGDEPHPMHIHGMQFQVLDRTGGRNKLIPTETGWKDTVLVMPGEKVRTIMTFPQNKGLFVVHCHNLEHEDDGMMLQFEIK